MSHIHKLIDFTVAAYIVNRNKVLLVKHKKLKTWLPVGGHIELDEDPEEGIRREIEEECGLSVKFLTNKPSKNFKDYKFLYTPNFLDIHKINKEHRHISLTYFAKSKSQKVILNKKEHDDTKWFSAKELGKIIYKIKDGVKFYSKQAIKEAKK